LIYVKQGKQGINGNASILVLLVFALLFLSSSVIGEGTASSGTGINCRIKVCAYVGVSGAISAVYGTKIIKTITTPYTVYDQLGSDYAAGVVVVPDESSPSQLTLINTTTNSAFKVIKSASFSSPAGALYNPAANVVLVSNSGSDTLSVIDATTWKLESKTITVGMGPAYFGYNPANNEVYVSNFANPNNRQCGQTVSVLRASTDKVIKTITVGSCPSGIAFNPMNNETYVANGGSGTISVIDLNNKIVKTIAEGVQPIGVNYGGGRIFVTDRENNAAYIISPSNKVRVISGFNASTIAGAYDPSNRYEYIALFPSPYVQIVFDGKILRNSIYEPLGPFAIITTAMNH
jgi:YVTN family beta-propeller protein